MQLIGAPFLTGLGQSGDIYINGEGFRFKVRVNLVNDGGDYELHHPTWTVIQTTLHLNAGMSVIFTKVQNNEIWMMAFNRDGSPFTNAHFFGATKLRVPQPAIPPEDTGSIYRYFIILFYNQTNYCC